MGPSSMTTFSTGSEFFEKSSAEISQRKMTVENTRKKGGRMTADDAPLREKSRQRPIPLKVPLQDFVLLNVAHANQPTASKNGLAAFRILGLFESSDHLQRHASTKLSDTQQTTKMEEHPTHAYKLIPRSPLDPEAELQQIQTLYNTHQENAAKSKEEFEKYCNARAAKEVDEHAQLDLLSAEKQKRKNRTELLTSNTATTAGGKHDDDDDVPYVPGQRYAAVGVVLDTSERLEHAICVYGAFESEEKCERYVEETLTDAVKDIPLFVLDMYRWVYPDVIMSSMGDNIPTGYRHDELHKIMTAHDEERRMREKVKEKIEVTDYTPEEAEEFRVGKAE